MLKRFVPQKPVSSVGERSLHLDTDDNNNHLASREQPRTSTIMDYQKPMADHGGKDILSSDVEIKGSIKLYGKVHGNITVGERCELKSKCTLQGDLKAARLVIEEGATFIGKSEVTSGALPKAAPGRPEVVRHDEPLKAAFGGRG